MSKIRSRGEVEAASCGAEGEATAPQNWLKIESWGSRFLSASNNSEPMI